MLSRQRQLFVRVERVTQETAEIRSYILGALDGGTLPAFAAGAHVGIVLPSRTTRYYSICSSPRELAHYQIAVHRVANGCGGSREIHERVRTGMMLKLEPQRNFFALREASSYLLIAGGIGITPIRSMMYELDARGLPYQLVCCARSPAHLVFADEMRNYAAAGKATVHFSDDRQKFFDFASLLAEPVHGRHIYCCGPIAMMQAVKQAANRWDSHTVHFEAFAPSALGADDKSFDVILRRSGRRIPVPADQSILTALREHGLDPDAICEAGTCGACRTPLLSGEIDHRDHILSSAERGRFIMICVSRSKHSDHPIVIDC